MKKYIKDLQKNLAVFLILISVLGIVLLKPFSIVSALNLDDRFEFVSLPEEVYSGEIFNFTLKALDDSQNINTSYLGTVSFLLSTDDNAVLPSDYTFTEEDAGQHVFSGVAKLFESGEHLINVIDESDSSLFGQVAILVSEDESLENEVDTGLIEIVSPVSGETEENTVIFSGTADPGLEISVYDNGELLMTDYVDTNGDFNFSSPVLPNGEYRFVLKTSTASSEEILLNIDASADILDLITVDKSTVVTGDVINVSVSLSEGASIVKVLLDEDYTELNLTDTIFAKTFEGQVKVPDFEGEYPLNLQIIKGDGEAVDLKAVELITVNSKSIEEVLEETHSAGDESDLTFFVPSQVFGVKLIPGDKKVDLTWSQSTDNNYIDHYLIYYGTDVNNLDMFVETANADTAWYIPNLTNGVTYYFTILGVDDEGNQGDQASVFVSAMPSIVGSNTMHGSGEGQVVVSNTAETGPEIYILLIFAFAFSYFFKLAD